MSNDMKIKAIAPWFGGKRTLGCTIAQELGPHRQFVEAFCGSMAVLFAKEPCGQETVNDLHGDLTNLAWVLQDEKLAIELYDRAQRTLFAESMIKTWWRELAETTCADQVDPERAYKWFCFSWAMRNGVAGTSRVRGNGFQIALRFTYGGGSPTVRFRSATESIPAWHERLRNVVILRRNAFELLERFDDDPGLAIYADPPYASETRSGFEANGATSRYEHEFDHERTTSKGLFDLGQSSAEGERHTHERLAKLLRRFEKARVVVSYYDCPRIRRLYEGWTFVEVARQKNLHVQNRRGTGQREEAPEIMIINGPSLAGTETLSA